MYRSSPSQRQYHVQQQCSGCCVAQPVPDSCCLVVVLGKQALICARVRAVAQTAVGISLRSSSAAAVVSAAHKHSLELIPDAHASMQSCSDILQQNDIIMKGQARSAGSALLGMLLSKQACTRNTTYATVGNSPGACVAMRGLKPHTPLHKLSQQQGHACCAPCTEPSTPQPTNTCRRQSI
jgi:hypothetical protein